MKVMHKIFHANQDMLKTIAAPIELHKILT